MEPGRGTDVEFDIFDILGRGQSEDIFSKNRWTYIRSDKTRSILELVHIEGFRAFDFPLAVRVGTCVQSGHTRRPTEQYIVLSEVTPASFITAMWGI